MVETLRSTGIIPQRTLPDAMIFFGKSGSKKWSGEKGDVRRISRKSGSDAKKTPGTGGRSSKDKRSTGK